MEARRFLHPPRTGGSSVARAWGLGKDEYRGHKPPGSGDGWAYGFTRNPWDRVVSLYHLAHRGVPSRGFADWVLGGMVADGSGGRRFAPHVTRPTISWLRDADWVGHYETRGPDLAELAGILGRPAPVDAHENASRHRSAPYWRYYAGRSDVVEWVAERYRQDVDVFRHRFVEPEGLFLYSLPGSGTRFVFEHVLADRHPELDLRMEHPYRDRDPGAVVGERLRDGWAVVVPVRDPVLTLLSNANGRAPQARNVGLRDMRALLRWRDDPRVLFWRVDPAPSDRRDALRALARHTGVVIRRPVEWGDPAGRWRTPDRTGARAAYLAGERHDAVAEAIEEVRSDPEVAGMYRDMGYDLG